MGQGQVKGKPLPKNELRSIKPLVSFSENEIHEWYSDFCQRSRKSDGDSSKFLNEEEFVKVYNSVYTNGNSEQFAKHVFRTFDKNGDGRLDFREFLIGMSMSGSSDPETLLSWAFKVYDIDSTGYIDRSEMTEIFKSVFRLLGPDRLHFEGVDKTPESLADEIFSKMDSNGDHKISRKEFFDGATSNPFVIRLLQCNPLDQVDGDGDSDVF